MRVALSIQSLEITVESLPEDMLCYRCGEEWPPTEEFWHFRRGKPQRPCKACRQEKRYATNAVTPCCVPGCTRPRHTCKSGVQRYSRCKEHTQALYRAHRYDQKKAPGA